ncbi:MAG: hypothetical protein DMF41_11920 [Verrucomicrobia bacterium]|nr:MAG: hypothetical protein DMF41_11920 [Verrucomicrobiota bacterium]
MKVEIIPAEHVVQKHNAQRFPSDFMLRLTADEVRNLRCQFGISKWGGRRAFPYAVTEQGIAILFSVLNSKRAGERTRIACWRWRPRHRKLLPDNLPSRSATNFTNCFSARRRKGHAGRVCSPE